MKAYNYLTLTLKRFSTPQETSFSAIPLEMLLKCCGNYMSFHSHNFLSIKPCDQASVASAYSNLLEERKQRILGMHIVQTITLMGESSSFWEEEPAVLFVTMLQAKRFQNTEGENEKELCYVKLLKKLKQRFAECHGKMGGTPECALYYSYDFCDYVLFAKKIDIEQYNSILWDMTTSRDEAFLCVRDTYSLFSFHTKELFMAMKGNCPSSMKKLLIPFSLRLSVYSSNAYEKLKNQLATYGIEFEESLIFSRYDVELRTAPISGEQFGAFLSSLDDFFNQHPQPFGDYELMPISPFDKENNHNGKDPWRDECFITALKPWLEKDVSNIDRILQDYVKETLRSLRELLLNGFSNEFLLGILDPCLNGMRLLVPPENDPRQPWEYFEDREKLTTDAHQFFNALNVLKLSMMHGERRFIQAPAFNASYFDIPPKLFAYYASVIRLVTKTYRAHSCEEPTYSFLMVPDFCPGIRVCPIPQKETDKTQYRLALVYLSEKFFYDPLKAIYLVLHETAHYLSPREREKRANEIFFSVSACLLVFLPVGSLLKANRIDAMMDRQSLLGVIAGELGDRLREEYEESRLDNRIPYSFISIQEFLTKNDYGISLLRNAFTKGLLIQAWTDAIQKLHADKKARAEVISALKRIQKIAGDSEFLTKMYPDKLACEVLAAHIAKQVDDYFYEEKEKVNDYYSACENILTAYRESFADHRMIQVVGKEFKPSIYEELLDSARENLKNIDFEFTIRHDAVLGYYYPRNRGLLVRRPEGSQKDCKNQWLLFFLQTIVIKGIRRYLDSCKMNIKCPDELKEAVRVFSKDDPKSQYMHIMKMLADYRKYIVEHVGDMDSFFSETLS